MGTWDGTSQGDFNSSCSGAVCVLSESGGGGAAASIRTVALLVVVGWQSAFKARLDTSDDWRIVKKKLPYISVRT